jgi:hypothetical protein
LFGDLSVAHVEVPKSSFQRPEFKIIAYNSEQPSLCAVWWKSKTLVYPILARMAKY